MSKLRIGIKNSILYKHYQQGALRLLPVPVHNDRSSNEFFAFLSTLGGGLVDKDNYSQEFELVDSKASLCSQSNQKIYKGTSQLNTKINIKGNSTLVFFNDANIFYQNSNFTSISSVNLSTQSKMFYLDGGYTGYAKDLFKTKMITRVFINHKLLFNDVFVYEQKCNLNVFLKQDYFYTILIKDNLQVQNIHTDELIVYSSKIKDLLVIRILASDNDIAIDYINNLRQEFMTQNNMTYVKIHQF